MKEFNTLGSLVELDSNHDAIHVDGIEKQCCLKILEKMLLIRRVENKLAEGKKNGLIGGPVHLGVGQEAIAVGVSENINNQDYVFGAHRSHSHIISLGTDIKRLFAEILGRNSGLCKGMGGSMHLWDKSVGFHGAVPIVAGTVSIAVGAALASKLKKDRQVSIIYLGDGACEEGVVHESLNLAAIQKLPIIFVVENNLYASHMDISERQPQNSTARFAIANNIPYKILDGNNVLEVKNAAKSFVSKARNGLGPGFIEAITYRWYGHVDWRDDIDVGINRSKDQLDMWKKKDPIKRLVIGMIQENFFSEPSFREMKSNIEKLVDKLWEEALKEDYPNEESLIERVYCS